MGSSQTDQSNDNEGDSPLETDPTNRFQRCDEILGEGAYKHVYRAFDQEEGVEVAWNQLRFDHLSKKEAQKILSEIEILQSIRNDHIINFYASWSTKAPNGGERIVFVTELMSSGTLKQYLKKTLKGALKPKVLKSWCRQILQGLVYLHTHDPPIIHRDLKCDNIFINGNNGQLKIGDLGLAVVRHRTHVSSVLGTPEFMAPELYDERYDEKVDIYAFGMCVLEMVTKEYPYSECTNQAQIYRKVTKGIKPQSLDHVQDPETREFINRCLDHDDRTRPSAQELLDSDFLLPCATAPPMSGAAMGLFHHPFRSLTMDGLELMDNPLSASATPTSNRSSFADPFLPSSISPTSTYSSGAPAPSMLARTNTLPAKVYQPHPQSIAIPTTEFTTTTVDADNKTYHIRSNILPQTPTSAEHDTETNDEHGALTAVGRGNHTNGDTPQSQDQVSDTPTLHSHANSKTCSIQVVQYGEAIGNHLNLKMICTCPVAGPRDVTVAAGTHEIKFPFDLEVDTVDEVVAEMIREQILSGDDREEAIARIQELVHDVVNTRRVAADLASATTSASASQHPHQQSRAVKPQEVDVTTSRKNNHHHHHRNNSGARNGQHRQLNVPPGHELDTYGTSPIESTYDHYFSIGSNTSIDWRSSDSPIESDQGYGTVHHPKSPQHPPAITETTFPPLHLTHPPRGNNSNSNSNSNNSNNSNMVNSNNQFSLSERYSDVVQHPVMTHSLPNHPLSPLLAGSDRTPSVSQRPLSTFYLDQKPATPQASEAKSPIAASSSADRSKEDVGYTSPYRHGVSSSSITSHRRSPSVDASVMISASISAPILSPTPAPTSLTGMANGLCKQPLEVDMRLLDVSSAYQGVSGTSHDGRPSLPHELLPTHGHSDSLHRVQQLHQHQHSVSPDSGISSTASSVNDPSGVQSHALTTSSLLSSQTPTHERRHTLSANPVHVDAQHSHQHAFLPQHSHASAPVHEQPLNTLNGGSSVIVMTNEAKKDIEQWSNSVQQPTIDPHTSGYNGSNYSSCPELSDDDEILDDDLKVLREQQRQELELMRLQHVQQWDKMMKLKEQKSLRKSETNNTILPPPSTATAASPAHTAVS
ncbi:Serine/threonine-protein kinase wnk4 [Podila humilis]|nr:Serine/threonine-protein kinase wnk4 [Podila humilis]